MVSDHRYFIVKRVWLYPTLSVITAVGGLLAYCAGGRGIIDLVARHARTWPPTWAYSHLRCVYDNCANGLGITTLKTELNRLCYRNFQRKYSTGQTDHVLDDLL